MSEGITDTGRRALLAVAAMVAAILLSSGVALAITKTCEAEVVCFGTKNPDTLNGSDGNDGILARGAADTLKGFGGNDLLYGQGGADKLFGGPGLDSLTGGPGKDTLNGGADPDFYYFGNGWGRDSITDNATSENGVVFDNGPAKGEEVPVSDDLTITLIAGDGPEAKTASGTSILDWEANGIKDVHSGSGDDQITGNFLANSIFGGSGADDIFAGAGNDIIRVDDGSGSDVVDCGESFVGSDNDTVVYDPGDEIASNCETKIPGL